MNFFKNNRGAATVEFALVILPVMLFIIGIMQTGWIVWIDNVLHVSVDAAARCGAVPTSTTLPCQGSGLVNMTKTANAVFAPMTGATFVDNDTCSADGGSGLVGTYNVSIAFVVNLTLTAKSCYPTVS
jgi:Flp pilus assembly protein TadG